MKIYPISVHADFLRFLFKEDSLKIKKSLEIVFDKNFSFVILHKLVKFQYKTVLISNLFGNVFCVSYLAN